MTGGKISTYKEIALWNSGILNMSGTAQIIAEDGAYGALYCSGENTVATITSGTIISGGGPALDITNEYPKINISGTTRIECTGDQSTIANSGDLTITGGNISATNGYAIRNYATGVLNISGTVLIEGIGNNPTIFNNGYNTKYATATITGGSISATNNYAIQNGQYGTVYLSSNCSVTGGTDGTITPYSGT